MRPENVYSMNSTKILMDRKIKPCTVVNVRIDSDKEYPYISGCTVMPTGHIVLCDRNNNRIKLVDDSWLITVRLELPSPWTVSAIDSINVIVSLPNAQQLQNVQVFPKMKAGSTIKLDKKCWGVAVYVDEIYVELNKDLKEGEVRVLDLKVQLKRCLEINPSGSNRFTSPYYITVSAFDEKIFVSVYHTNTIVCLTPSGNVIYKYKDHDVSRPRGLICDAGDAVLACGEYSQNVHIISPDGKKYYTLLTTKNKLRDPCSNVYIEKETTLIVGGYNINELKLFQLA